MSKLVAGVTKALTTGASSLFSGLPLVLLVACGVSLLGGAGGTIWYRMKWLDEIAAGAQALAEQQAIDKRENAKAIGQLTSKLNANEAKYEYDMQLLSNIPKNASCERDLRIDFVREQLCKRYPDSEACSRPRPPR